MVVDGIDHANGNRWRNHNIDTARLQFSHSCRGLGDKTIGNAIQLGRTTPVLLECFKKDILARAIADHPEWPGTYRIAVEVVIAMLLDVSWRHNHGSIASQFR